MSHPASAVEPLDEASPSPHPRRPAGAIEVTFDPRWSLECWLDFIDDRLANAHLTGARLAAEGASIAAEAYFARLRKRRRELLAQLHPPRPVRPDGPKAPPGEPWPSHDWAHGGPDLAPNATPMTQRSIQGTVAPVSYLDVPQSQNVHHDSSYDVGTDTSAMDRYGTAFTDARLYDDAAWWRRDEADSVRGLFQVAWELPTAEANALVQISISVSHLVTLEIHADWSQHSSFAVLVHGDPDGVLPGKVDLATHPHERLVWGVRRSGQHASPVVGLTRRFLVRRGATPRVILGHGVQVWALDGSVRSLTQSLTHGGAAAGPHLEYRIWYYQQPSLLEELRVRAYRIWEARGRGDGHALDDWLQAEREFYG